MTYCAFPIQHVNTLGRDETCLLRMPRLGAYRKLLAAYNPPAYAHRTPTARRLNGHIASRDDCNACQRPGRMKRLFSWRSYLDI